MCSEVIVYADGHYTIGTTELNCTYPYYPPATIIRNGKEGHLYRIPQGQEKRVLKKVANQLLKEKQDAIQKLEREKYQILDMYSEFL